MGHWVASVQAAGDFCDGERSLVRPGKATCRTGDRVRKSAKVFSPSVVLFGSDRWLPRRLDRLTTCLWGPVGLGINRGPKIGSDGDVGRGKGRSCSNKGPRDGVENCWFGVDRLVPMAVTRRFDDLLAATLSITLLEGYEETVRWNSSPNRCVLSCYA